MTIVYKKYRNLTLKLWPNGAKVWLNFKGLRHRTDGPAYEGFTGDKSWWINGKQHRTDGPAVEYSSGDKLWYLRGKEYTKKDFNKKIKELK